MSYELAGRRVLVTGASTGIGAGLAEGFAKAGATVGICARRKDMLAEVLERCQQHSPDSRMWVVDLSDMAAVDQLAAQATEELGQVDVLVNNAGIPKRRHVTRLDIETIEKVMHINYLSPMRLTMALLPQMLERGEGRIVNIASVAATISSPGEAAYDASKAALSVFSEAMAVDLWDSGIKLTIVYPGVVDTELFHLPDNDPFTTPVERIPVADAVEPILAAVRDERLELYVPESFGDLAHRKGADPPAFLAGMAQYMSQAQSAG